MASGLIKNFTEHVQPLVPGYVVKRKSQSRVMRFLSKLLFFTSNFMTQFTTTIGNTVYVTDNQWDSNTTWTLATLAHEARHVYDKQRYSMPLFSLGYLFPQILVLLALLSFFSVWWLTALAFLAPIPAFFRMLIERQGYLMTLCVIWWAFGKEAAYEEIPYIVKQFTGPAYFFMWPFKQHLENWFKKQLAEKAVHPSRHAIIYVLVFDFVNSGKKP